MKNIHKIGEIDTKETRNFLYRIAKNTAIDYYNKRKLENSVTEAYNEEVIILIDELKAKEILANAVFTEQLTELISTMNTNEQQIIILKYYEDLSDKKIGETLGISEEAVRKRLSRARMRLASIMQNRMGGEAYEK